MSAQQQQVLRAVVDAINAGRSPHDAVNAEGPAATRYMSMILRILRLPDVGFRHGEPSEVVLARILDLLKAHAEHPDSSQRR